MVVIRCALIATGAGLFGNLMVLPALAREIPGLPLWHTDQPYTHCWPAWPSVTNAGDFGLLLGLDVLLIGGLVLLACQRTIGLLLTAAAALVGTMMLVPEIPSSHFLTPPQQMLFALVPGLVLSWAAVIVWSRPILRFLPGSRTMGL